MKTEIRDRLLKQKLLDAAKANNIDGVREALKLGAEVNAKDDWDYTPLIWAARYGYTEIANLLIAAKAEVNAKNKYGDTPLIWAASNGYTEIANMLKEAGAK